MGISLPLGFPPGVIGGPNYGPELLTNGDFSAWTADNPDSWIVSGESGSDPEVSEVDAGQSHGGTNVTGGYCNIYTSGPVVSIRQAVLVVGDLYEIVIDANLVTSGRLDIGVGETTADYSVTVAGIHTFQYVAHGTTFFIKRGTGSDDVTINSVSVRKVIG